jgi:hypothetical protein
MSFNLNPIIVSNASAFCKDCSREVARGDLEIYLGDCLQANAMAMGSLFRECTQHHDRLRQYEEDSLQHNQFMISQGERRIGRFGVASVSIEAYMSVDDKRIRQQLNEMASVVRREKGI